MTGIQAFQTLLISSVNGAASLGDTTSRSTPWVKKFSMSLTCLALSCAASEKTMSKPAALAAASSCWFMAVRHGSALFACDIPIRYLAFGLGGWQFAGNALARAGRITLPSTISDVKVVQPGAAGALVGSGVCARM